MNTITPQKLVNPLLTASSALALLLVALAFPALIAAQPATKEPAQIDLLTAAPFDRLTLSDGNILYIEPVLPRPLAAYDPAKEARKKRTKREVPFQGNIGLPGEKSKVEKPETDDTDPASELIVHLLQGEVRDFKVKRTSLRSLEYFEDMLIAEAERLTLAREYARAFECLLKVQARNPSWRGLDDMVNRCLFAEGNTALLDNDGERGLRLLGELAARKPDFPGLADKLATSYGARASRALEIGLHARGRKILHDVEQLAPNHPIVRGIRTQFIAKAQQLAQSAAKKEGPDRLDAIAEALRVWPALEGAEASYRAAFSENATLDVAVLDVPRAVGPWIRSPADERITRLLYLPVLARDDDEAVQGKADRQLAVSVTSSDLGRRSLIKLRPGILWNDGSRPVSAIDVARALTEATDPQSPRYNARWADLLDRVESPAESQVEIRLTRAFLKPNALLLGPVGPAHVGTDGRLSSLDASRELVGDGPFRFFSASSDRADLRAVSASSKPDTALKIRRIKELRQPTAPLALGAFMRGEVSMIAHVPPDRVAALAANPDYKVGRFTRPSLHRIALDGRTLALRNRNLRRALSYALDRRTLFEETILRHPADDLNRLADGPFPKGSYADAPDVKPLDYDPLLAKMLVAAARRELGNAPIKLTLDYPAMPESQAVVPRIVESLALVGIAVVATERPESELESSLRAGRRFDLAYRAGRCDEPFLDAGPLLSPAYDAPPHSNPLASIASPRILQLLLQLERAPEWPSARALAIQIDRECRDELPILPLWQVEDHYAWHTRLKGPKPSTDQLYEGIESWEIEPWFARDSW